MTDWFPIESPGSGSALRRSGDAKIAGVSGGLEARLGIDRNIIRVGFVVLALAGGAGFAAYLGAWILMPVEGAGPTTRQTGSLVFGGGLLAIAAILALVTIGGIEPVAVAVLGLAFAGVVVLNRRPRPQPAPAPMAGPAPMADPPPPHPFSPPPTLIEPPPTPPPPAAAETGGPARPPIPAGVDPTTEFEPSPTPDPTTELRIAADADADRTTELERAATPNPAPPPPPPPPAVPAPPPAASPTSPTSPTQPQPAPSTQPDPFRANSYGSSGPVDGGPRAHWAMTRTADETILAPPKGPEARRPSGPPLASITIAALLAILGLALVITTVAGSYVGAVAVIGTGLAVVGLMVIVSAFVGRTARLVPLAVLLLVLLPAAPIIDQAIGDGVGTTDITASRVGNLDTPYRLGIGELRLDLSRLEITEDTPVEVVIGTGSMVVIVPPETAVELHGETTIGYVSALGEERAGIGSDLNVQPPPSADPDAPRLILDLSATVGSVEVYRGRPIVDGDG